MSIKLRVDRNRFKLYNSPAVPFCDVTGKSIKEETTVKREFSYEVTSKRHKGYPSETNVKRGFPRRPRR